MTASITAQQRVAVALAFAGRFGQLLEAASGRKARDANLKAMMFAVDRTRRATGAQMEPYNAEDVVKYLTRHFAQLELVPPEDWRPYPRELLHESACLYQVKALDSLLLGKALPAGRLTGLRNWLAPFLEKSPDLRQFLPPSLIAASPQKP